MPTTTAMAGPAQPTRILPIPILPIPPLTRIAGAVIGAQTTAAGIGAGAKTTEVKAAGAKAIGATPAEVTGVIRAGAAVAGVAGMPFTVEEQQLLPAELLATTSACLAHITDSRLMKTPVKASTLIRANKRKARLKAKRRRQRARATS